MAAQGYRSSRLQFHLNGVVVHPHLKSIAPFNSRRTGGLSRLYVKFCPVPGTLDGIALLKLLDCNGFSEARLESAVEAD